MCVENDTGVRNVNEASGKLFLLYYSVFLTSKEIMTTQVCDKLVATNRCSAQSFKIITKENSNIRRYKISINVSLNEMPL